MGVFTEYEKVTTLENMDTLLVGGERGTNGIYAKDLANDMLDKMDGSSVADKLTEKDIMDKVDYNDYPVTDVLGDADSLIAFRGGSGKRYSVPFGKYTFYNKIANFFRGKWLGESPTLEQLKEIKSGSFGGLFIGDYWGKEDRSYSWVIAGINTNNVVASGGIPHICVMFEQAYGPGPLHSGAITDVGYLNCDFRKGTNGNTWLETIKSDIFSRFDEQDVLIYRDHFAGSVDVNSNFVISTPDTNAQIELMSELMVYGTYLKASAFYNPNAGELSFYGMYPVSKIYQQLPVFQSIPWYSLSNIWLRDPVRHDGFACIDGGFMPSSTAANSSRMFKPFFLLKGRDA